MGVREGSWWISILLFGQAAVVVVGKQKEDFQCCVIFMGIRTRSLRGWRDFLTKGEV